MPRKLKNIELNRLSVDEFKKTQKLPICVVLDNVRSMLNVGSVFRTSDAFLVDELYLCGITAKPPHRDITKTAIGAENTVTWSYHESTLDAINALKSKGYTIVGVEQTDASELLSSLDYKSFGQVALVFGNEVDGVSDEVVEACDYLVEIQQLGTKHSLNVSVCAGVSIWEVAKHYM